jgi:hypothetical protein
MWKTMEDQAAVVDHGQDPEVRREVVEEPGLQHLLQLAWEHWQERNYSIVVTAPDPAVVIAPGPVAVILDDAETAQIRMIVEARPQSVVKTANEARVLRTWPEKVLPLLVSVRRPKVENHGRMLERLKKHMSAELVAVVEVEEDEGADLMKIIEVLDALEMLVDMPSLVVIRTEILDMQTRGRATSIQGVVVVVLLDRGMVRRTNALQKGSRAMDQIRIAVWVPRQVMRSASRR